MLQVRQRHSPGIILNLGTGSSDHIHKDMAKENFCDRMRGREILPQLSVVELFLLAIWCLLGLIFKLVNVGFAAVDEILGVRFEQYRATSGEFAWTATSQFED